MTAPAVRRDRAVWRVTGSPLVPATGSGPLAGQTVAVKDLYAVAGFAIGAGVRDFLAERAPEARHATVVAALLAAGAEITGLAHTDEFAYSITGGNGGYGMPVNPAAPQRIPGGSSSGSAVAVARGEVTVGLGTDTAGSIRVPGAYQGLWGIRTTTGRVDRTGVLPLAPSFDAVGWLTRDAATLAAVGDCLLDDREVDTAAPELVVDPELCAQADAPIAAAVRSAAEQLGARPIALRADLDAGLAAFRTVQAAEAWAAHGPWIRGHPRSLEPEVAARFAYAATVDPGQAEQARTTLARLRHRLRDALGDRVLVLPSTAALPPHRAAEPAVHEVIRVRTLRLTCLAALAGLPAVTVPWSRIGGIPVGLCLLGPADRDRMVLRLAARRLGHLLDPAPPSSEEIS
ncbi:amidase family protein [Nocardia sp. NPDC050712]|uniref:amidase family protein n=1 Tax=Nocardia sp. NPDC050712 TaxID=3155518 RepID=UPI0033FB21B2